MNRFLLDHFFYTEFCSIRLEKNIILTLSFESKNEQISGKSKSAEKEKKGGKGEEEVAIFFRLRHQPSSAK